MSGRESTQRVRDELAALRTLVEDARSMPMSASVVLNRQELLGAVEQLDRSAAAALAEADDLAVRRDDVIAEGEASASEIVRQAELRRDEVVSDTEVLRLARREADQLLEAARRDAEALKVEAEAYVERRFAQFEHVLDRTLGEVRRGIAHLTGNTGLAPVDGDAADVLLPDHEGG